MQDALHEEKTDDIALGADGSLRSEAANPNTSGGKIPVGTEVTDSETSGSNALPYFGAQQEEVENHIAEGAACPSPESTEIVDPGATELQRVRSDMGAFNNIPRDVLTIIYRFLAIEDAENLARTCHTLSEILWKQLPNLSRWQRIERGLLILKSVVELTPLLRKQFAEAPHLSFFRIRKVLSFIRIDLDEAIKSDVDSGLKIAAMLGMEGVVEGILGDDIPVYVDSLGYGVMHYYAKGGQIECLKRVWYQYFSTWHDEEDVDDSNVPSESEIDQDNMIIPLDVGDGSVMLFNKRRLDPDDFFAKLAAQHGHIPLLEFLRDKLGYKLTRVFPAQSEQGYDRTLLHSAAIGGNEATVDFLEKEGAPSHVGKHLTFFAADNGHWRLAKRFAEQEEPKDRQVDEPEGATDKVLDEAAKLCNLSELSDSNESFEWLDNVIDTQKNPDNQAEQFWMKRGVDLKVKRAESIAAKACQSGNLPLLISLTSNPNYNINTKKLIFLMLWGGHAKIFWYFIEQGWLRLNDRILISEKTVGHELACRGHLPLLTDVVNDCRFVDKDGVSLLFALDSVGRSMLHYAATGGLWEVYLYLLKLEKEFGDEIERLDDSERTVAHIAAQVGSSSFLQRLYVEDPEIFKKTAKDGSTVLHAAGNGHDFYFLMMLIDFGIGEVDDKECDDEVFERKIQYLLAEDKNGDTVLHLLAKTSKKEPEFWRTIDNLVWEFGEVILNIENKKGECVLDLIPEEMQGQLSSLQHENEEASSSLSM